MKYLYYLRSTDTVQDIFPSRYEVCAAGRMPLSKQSGFDEKVLTKFGKWQTVCSSYSFKSKDVLQIVMKFS